MSKCNRKSQIINRKSYMAIPYDGEAPSPRQTAKCPNSQMQSQIVNPTTNYHLPTTNYASSFMRFFLE